MSRQLNQAAGLLIVCRRTGRCLLLRRSKQVSHPGKWAIPGGGSDRGESALQTALRETSEEAWFEAPMTVSEDPVHVFKRSGFQYLTYLGVVEAEFSPKLNWESDAYGWFGLGGLPDRIHPGCAVMLQHIARSA